MHAYLGFHCPEVVQLSLGHSTSVQWCEFGSSGLNNDSSLQISTVKADCYYCLLWSLHFGALSTSKIKIASSLTYRH